MDFLLSAALVKYEIGFLILNLVYIVFHTGHSIVTYYVRLREWMHPSRPVVTEQANDEEISIEPGTVETVNNTQKIEPTTKNHEPEAESGLSTDEKQQLGELIKLIRTKISRGEFHEARIRIIEGLAIDKFSKDLNLLLASLYEKEKDYKKAEMIYKDLIILNDTDPELYLKFGFALSIQGKYEVAYEVYKKLLTIDEGNLETIEMLANLGLELEHHRESNEYAKLFLRKFPRHVDMLQLVAINCIHLGDRREAIDHLQKIRTIEPYNAKVNEMIKKLELELELEKNFSGEEK